VLQSRAMSRPMRLLYILAALFACALQPRAQVVNLTPHCDEFGIFAWGQFSDGAASPAALKSVCDGTVTLPTISNATGASANQVAAFSAGRGVAFNGAVDWSSAKPLPTTFPPAEVVEVKVWVLFKKVNCDFSCVKLKMANFLVWANDRLSAERTGIQLAAAGGGTVDWVFDKTTLAESPPVSDLLDFSESGATDCTIVQGPSFPTSIRTNKVLNVYVIRTEKGTSHRGYYCRDARDAGFANAFVAFEATNSTILHELSHNLGLGHNTGILNVMNDDIQDGAFFIEGQIFRMNFSTKSALTIFGAHAGNTRNCALRPHTGCAAEGSWIWPDP
jgi:hypothetical protein